MKLCRVQVAAWVCLTLVVGSGAVRVGPSRMEEEGVEYPHHKYSAFQNVQFSINYETSKAKYEAELIDVMRNQLKSSTDDFFGIPSLPSKKVTGTNRFGLVILTYEQLSVSLVIDVNNIYVVGFYSNNPKANPPKAYYYFTGDSTYKDAVKLFDKDTKALSLGYGADYTALGGRSGVLLGRTELISAVEQLYYRKDINALKSKFVVIIQMISECVRSDFVLNGVSKYFEEYEGKAADGDMQYVENNWESNSKAVRGAKSATENFGTPITLPESKKVIKNVQDVIKVGLVSLLWSPTSTTNNIFMHWPAFPIALYN
ncbi:hypothetical protein Tsubulata_037224 [Turnera subulata]|uniref:rRNA N-glycosylase n=1 Tax=Turnera subulata TaxID=218843 RepID=A0A9Q0FP75_9ROSI|nr:hypothetical protein Tsubulata_037224 [Turnera subulata]